jgi:glycosyltransferase involved in cell wall biosynthesis
LINKPVPDLDCTKETKEHQLLCVAYVVSYGDPHYIRNRSLLKALGDMPEVKVAVARNARRGIWRYFETLHALLRLRATFTPDIYILGFRGHEIFWLVRFLTRGSPLAVDALMSPSAALAEENKAGLVGRLLAPLVKAFERSLLRRADLVLTDTRLHAEYLAHTFALPLAKICPLPVGAIEFDRDSMPNHADAGDPFRVLFYGSFLPLHGIDVIVAAAALLGDLPLVFDFIGGRTSQAKRLHRQCKSSNVRHTHRQWVPFDQILRTEIPRASLCLGGPFGGTPQARRVVTGKTSQCLALAKATIIGRIDEDYGFIDKVNCLLVDQRDPKALANTIRWAYENRAILAGIGALGKALYEVRLSTRVIGEQLLPALRRAVVKHSESLQK